MNGILVTARSQLDEALQSWWVGLYALTFGALALGLALVGSRGSGSLGFEGFSRTSASLLNACLLLAPLVALSLGAWSVAGERERGALAGMLAQPLTRWQFLAGVYTGLLAAIGLATVLGFGVAGMVIAVFSPVIDPGRYVMVLVLVVGLVGVMLALGMLISVVAGSRTRALGAALALWFVLVLFFDLGVIGVTLTGALGNRGMLAALMLNPIDAARVLAILRLEPSLDVLGPAGSYLADTVGVGGASALLCFVLAGWLLAPLVAAGWVFNRQDV